MENIPDTNENITRNNATFAKRIYILCWLILLPAISILSAKTETCFVLVAVLAVFMGYLTFNKRFHWNALQQWGVLCPLFFVVFLLLFLAKLITSSELMDASALVALVTPLFGIPIFISFHLVKMFFKPEITITITNRTKWIFLLGWICLALHAACLVCDICNSMVN